MLAFLLRYYRKKIRFFENGKPYFQFVNLSRNIMYLIFTLLPYSFPINYLINSKMVTAIFGVSKYIDNSFIYSCLILKNIKRTCTKKSLITSGPKTSCLLHKLFESGLQNSPTRSVMAPNFYTDL